MENSTEILGARLLSECEEGSLEGLLKDLRLSLPPTTLISKTGLPLLDNLSLHHPQKLSITGRGLPLIYHLITHLVHVRKGTVVILDCTSRFSTSHLSGLSREELGYIHIFFCTKENLRVTMEGLEGYMLGGGHGSEGREWVGTIVIGGEGGEVAVGKGGSEKVEVSLGWRGWLRVEREGGGEFGEGWSVEEAWRERERSRDINGKKGWRGVCEEGDVVFGRSG